MIDEEIKLLRIKLIIQKDIKIKKIKMEKKLDTKAWIRILEVFIAILIIMSSFLIILSRRGPISDINDEVYEKQRQIINIISKNNDLRADIISGNNMNVDNKISQMIPSHWSFATRICGLDEVCPLDLAKVYEQGFEVYSTEVVVTSNLTQYSPKKLRFFVWVEN